MVQSDSQPTHNRRLILLALVISLSVVLPVFILIGSAYSAFSGWPLGLVIAEQHKIAAGAVKNGELWYIVTKYFRSTYSPPCESRIVRLDLKSGDIRETGLKLPQVKRKWEEFDLIWMAESLYVVDRFASTPSVWKASESDLELFTVLPTRDPATDFMHAPFFLNGQLTMIEQNLVGEFRLSTLVNGTWENGRQIRLPSLNSRWIQSPEGPRIVNDLEQPNKRTICYLTAMATDTDVHLRFVTVTPPSRPIFAAYRKGFEYIDDTEVPSAQSPENLERDPAGWEKIHAISDSAVWWGPISVERDTVLLGIHNERKCHFVRREADGRWTVLSGLEPSTGEFEWDSLITGPSEQSYVCRQSNEWWNRFAFYPIEGDTIGPAQLKLPGHEKLYLNRWGRFVGGLILAWVTHVVVLLWGQQLSHSSTSEYEFALHKVLLAPLRLRGLAFLMDAIVIVLFVAISFSIHWSFLGVEWDRDASRKISRLLMLAEMNIDSWRDVADFNSWRVIVDIISDPKEVLGCPHDLQQFLRLILTVFVDTFLPLWIYRTYNEGKTGVTFGKWLTGIRAVRLTLRPCGFARAIVRSAMNLVDYPLFITPLPATISMMLSPCRQRLGDRVADTVVIRSR